MLAISLVINFYFYTKYRDTVSQKRQQNDSMLWSIAVSGNNLANRLEHFLSSTQQSEVENNEELHAQLTDLWRIVLGESRNNRFDLARITSPVLGKSETKWELLQLGLLRTCDLLDWLNIKFLEQGTYDLTAEEIEQLEAVIKVYQKIHEEIKSESDHPELVIDELTEQLIIIDSNYADLLARLEQN